MGQSSGINSGSKISIALTCIIITAGYTAYRDINKSIPTKDTVEANRMRIQATIDWDKEEFKNIAQERRDLEARISVTEAKHHEEVLRRLEIIEGVERDMLSRLPPKRLVAY